MDKPKRYHRVDYSVKAIIPKIQVLVLLIWYNKEEYFHFFWKMGENLKTFKKRPWLRNLGSERTGNLRNSPVLEKTHRFLYCDCTECMAQF